jgi:putative ABC transport system permease protein
VLALGIVAMSVGLVRGEAARDMCTLTATKANGTTRRIITAATAGALALTGAVTGIIGAYLRGDWLLPEQFALGLSLLTGIPVTNLLVIPADMPLAATALGWLLADRDPADVARQPLE